MHKTLQFVRYSHLFLLSNLKCNYLINTVFKTNIFIFQAVDVRQIYDKFPEKKGGLKELYDKGPQPAFFLVKFWADLNTNIQDEAGAFYGVTSQ